MPVVDYTTFDRSNYKSATLHVPAASIDAYSSTKQWKDFGKIIALAPSGIEVSTVSQQPTVVERYDLSGRHLNQAKRGVNIIKMSDGTTKKVIVKLNPSQSLSNL